MPKLVRRAVIALAVVGVWLHCSIGFSAEFKGVVVGPKVNKAQGINPTVGLQVRGAQVTDRPSVDALKPQFRLPPALEKYRCVEGDEPMCPDMDQDGLSDNNGKIPIDPAVTTYAAVLSPLLTDAISFDPVYTTTELSPATRNFSNWIRVKKKVGPAISFFDPLTAPRGALASDERDLEQRTGLLDRGSIYNGVLFELLEKYGISANCPSGVKVETATQAESAGCKPLTFACVDPDGDFVCSQTLYGSPDSYTRGNLPPDLDNCPFVANISQRNHGQSFYGVVGDGAKLISSAPSIPYGDACTVTINGVDYPDTDGDGIQDDKDNCPFAKNPDQAISKNNPKVGAECGCDKGCRLDWGPSISIFTDFSSREWSKKLDSNGDRDADYTDGNMFITHPYYRVWLEKIGIQLDM